MDLKNVKHIGFPRLPAEYQEVEYLSTAADGYIDSGFAFTQPELSVLAVGGNLKAMAITIVCFVPDSAMPTPEERW